MADKKINSKKNAAPKSAPRNKNLDFSKKVMKEHDLDISESVFIREVNEDLQSAKLNDFAKKYAVHLSIVVGIIIVCLLSYTIFNQVKASKISDEADRFQTVVLDTTNLLKDKKFDEAKVELNKFIATAHYDYKDIAFTMLYETSLNSTTLYSDEMKKLFVRMETEAHTKKLRDFATFNYAILRNNSGEIDAKGLEQALTPLMTSDNVFKYNSYVVVISTYLQEGKNDAASILLGKLEKESNLSTSIDSQIEKFERVIPAK